jgi:hypothetical protein
MQRRFLLYAGATSYCLPKNVIIHAIAACALEKLPTTLITPTPTIPNTTINPKKMFLVTFLILFINYSPPLKSLIYQQDPNYN